MIHTIYNLTSKPTYGSTQGTCRISGIASTGIIFDKWVKPTFTNWDDLYPGDIISNEALYFFEERNEDFTQKIGKDKTQKCRSYSHFLHNNKWHILTKADLITMVELIKDNCEWVCIADSGQKHIAWLTHKNVWNFEGVQIEKDIDQLMDILNITLLMYANGFSKKSIYGGHNNMKVIREFGFDEWRYLDKQLNKHRGSKIFDLAVFLTYKDESLKREIITHQKTLFDE